MQKTLKCNKCYKDREVFSDGSKASNGAIIWKNDKGVTQQATCRECLNQRQKIARQCKERIARDRSYELTPKGYIMRLYRNMKSRILGVQKVKLHLYEGKELVSKEEFYEWAMREGSPFFTLFEDYLNSGRDMKKAPSVDRINSDLGYTLENMEWVTHSENSRRGAISQALKRRV